VFSQTWFSCSTAGKKHHLAAFVKDFLAQKQRFSGLVGRTAGGKLNLA
jgi:hypothetical protein